MKRLWLLKTIVLALTTLVLTLSACQRSTMSDTAPKPMGSQGDEIDDPAILGEPVDNSPLAIEQRMRAYVTACPRNLDESALSYTVSGYFNDAIHTWREYPIGNGGRVCIVQEKPRAGVLTADEAIALLVASRTPSGTTSFDRYEIVDPSDPSLHIPPVPEPGIGHSLNGPARTPANSLQHDPDEPDPLDEGPGSGIGDAPLDDR